MGKFPTPGGGGGDWQNAPEGSYRAVIVDVVDLGWREQFFEGVSKGYHPFVKLAYQLDEANDDGLPYLVFDRPMKLSLHENSGLTKRLTSILGAKILQERTADPEFDTDELIGVNCRLSVIHNESNGTVFANVDTCFPYSRKDGEPLAPDASYTRRHLRDDWEQKRPSGPSAFITRSEALVVLEGMGLTASQTPRPESNAARAAALQGNGNGQGASANPPQASSYVPPALTAAQSEPASDAQLESLLIEAERTGYTRAELSQMTQRQFSVGYLRLTKDQAAQLLGTLREMKSSPDAITAKAIAARTPAQPSEADLSTVFDDEDDEPVLLQEPTAPAAAVTPQRAGAKATR